jgi:hypothetical protein
MTASFQSVPSTMCKRLAFGCFTLPLPQQGMTIQMFDGLLIRGLRVAESAYQIGSTDVANKVGVAADDELAMPAGEPNTKALLNSMRSATAKHLSRGTTQEPLAASH